MIKIRNVSKSYSDKVVLKDINLEIKKGEFVVLFGPNGCGKSTLLNIIAGLIESEGEVLIDGKPPKKEKIGYVFQNYRDSLLPWKTNLENIAFPLELDKIKKEKRIFEVKDLVKKVKLNVPLSNYPYQSSGGEQQLVSILREVITNPKIILMDEPFSALHHESRKFLRMKVQEIWKKLGLTILFVSHDINEAMQLADKIVIMDNGRIKKIFQISTLRPRNEDILFSEKFQSIRDEIK